MQLATQNQSVSVFTAAPETFARVAYEPITAPVVQSLPLAAKDDIATKRTGLLEQRRRRATRRAMR